MSARPICSQIVCKHNTLRPIMHKIIVTVAKKNNNYNNKHHNNIYMYSNNCIINQSRFHVCFTLNCMLLHVHKKITRIIVKAVDRAETLYRSIKRDVA